MGPNKELYRFNTWSFIYWAIVIFILISFVTCDKAYEGVKIYSNIGQKGRHLAKDGYNYGLKWQCVEFVKRYYYDKLNHKMPNTYGHAKDFFNKQLKDSSLNKDRGLYQYRNNGINKPIKGDLIVFDGTEYNPYGHVAIVDRMTPFGVIIYQQNSIHYVSIVDLNKHNILGWLRKED